MEIILAAPRGFCAGVNMAVQSLEIAIDNFPPPIYVYHEIVHNQYVVREFQSKGAIFVDDLNDIPNGATVLFSAHGVSPAIRQLARDRQLFAIDATCPLVTKVHLEAIKYAKAEYSIILIGHEGHDEVIGTMGEAPHAIILVQGTEDVDLLEFEPGCKLAYLTQTTLSVDDANKIISRLREKFPWIESPPKDDICYATQNRQEAVRLIAEQVDVVLVLGSQNSSNSQRLRELGIEQGRRAYLIDGCEDINPEWFEAADRVMVTAGASAPESVVQATIDWLVSRFGATVRSEVVKKEDVHFPLPKVLREFA